MVGQFWGMLEVSDGDLGRKHLENGQDEKHLKLLRLNHPTR